MHQQQWLAVIEELGPEHLPVPNSFPIAEENHEFANKFFINTVDGDAGDQEGSRGLQARRPMDASSSSHSRHTRWGMSPISALDGPILTGKRSRHLAALPA